MQSQYSWTGITIAILTFIIYFLTTNPLIKPFAGYLFVFSLTSIVCLCITIITSEDEQLQERLLKILTYLFISSILLGVGTTGWFTSPFMYLLFCLAISLAFLYDTLVSLTFVVTLVGMNLLQFNTLINVTSLLSIFSLFIIVPFSYYLSQISLKLKEHKKEILILKNPEKPTQNKVENLLSNKITKFAANLREPLTDIKQLTYFISKAKSIPELEKSQREILYSSEQALKILETFEKDSTGKILMENP